MSDYYQKRARGKPVRGGTHGAGNTGLFVMSEKKIEKIIKETPKSTDPYREPIE